MGILEVNRGGMDSCCPLAGAGAGAGEEAMLYFLGLMVISWLASTAELMLMDTNSRSVSVTSWTLYWDSYIITLLSL